ncbi:MAG: hypothetical protein QXZ02_05280 [Candidatus Bathyarchaeia archaeon]
MQRLTFKHHLLSSFVNRHVIVENDGFTIDGILLWFKPSRKNPGHEPFLLVLLTKHGKAIIRDFSIVKTVKRYE